MAKDYGFDFSKLSNKIEQMADKIAKDGENVERVAEKTGEQVGESFIDGVEQGFEDAASRIAASSLKINKAFKDLAKRITNQKDIFNISLGGKNVVLDIDFSDIDINGADFQKKIDEIFKRFKIDNAIEFDSKDVEKQFKDMLGLHVKYATKLSNLQTQKPKLTNPAHIKTNAQEQLAVIDGLKEIQRVMEQTAGTSLALPRVYFGDTKELHNTISLMEQMSKGEEKVAKQRDTNAKKISKEKKEIAERNKVLEEENRLLREQAGLTEGESVKPDKKPRTQKSKQLDEANKRRNELVTELNSYGDKTLDADTADYNLGQREYIYKLLAEENLLTEEIENNYHSINAELEQRRKLLESAREHEDDTTGKIGGRRHADTYDPVEYYDEWIMPFEKDIAHMRGSGLFDESEIQRFEMALGSMQDKLTTLSWNSLYDARIDPDSIEDVEQLNKILEQRNQILSRAETVDNPLGSPSAYEKELQINKAIEERISSLQSQLSNSQAVAEQTELNLAEEELKVEKEITAEKEKQTPKGVSGTQQEIKSQEELQKKIEDTNRVIKIQKEWLEYIDPVLDDETYKASGKKDAADKLKFRTNNLMDYRLHPEEYEWKQMYQEKAEIAQAKAYKEAERQGVAQSRLNKYYTDAVSSHDRNVEKLQKERALHEKILADAEKELEVLQQQLQVETKIEEVRKPKFKRTIDGEPKKFRMKKSEADQGVQTSIDDIVPKSAEDATPKVEAEAGGFDKVDKAANKASESKKKFAKANKEVAASVTPSVKGLETEADAMENVEEAAKKTSKTVSEEAKRAAEGMNFHTRDYEKLYDEMEAFAEQRKAENGYDLSKVSVNTDAHGNPLSATISYYKKATKETITETFKIDQAAQEAEEGVNRLVLSSRRATAGIADFEKATLGAINKQNTFAINTEKTISTMSAALDANANRTLIGKDGENEVRKKLEAIKAEAEKLKQDPNGVLDPLPEREFLAAKKRIAELIQEARVLIREKKNAAYGETLESNAVDAGTYRKDNLKAQINEWKRAGIYVGDLQNKGEALLKTVDTITDHAGLKKYLIGVKEANALAKLAIQDKKAEVEKQKKLNAECEEYIKLVKERDAIEKNMIGLNPEGDKDRLAALRRQYTAKDNEINDKYGDFLARDDVQEYLNFDELAERYDIDIKKGAVSDKRRKEEEAAAQKQVNEAYREYIRLVQERGRESVKLAGLDPEKNKAEIDAITAHIDSIDDKLNETYGGLLSNHIAQAALTLEDFMKYYDKWQQKLAEKEAKVADKARQKEEKPYRDYGKTTANSAERKRDNIQGEADALGVTNGEVIAKMDVYKAKVQEVLDLRAKFSNDPEAAKDPALVKQFQKAAAEAERTRRSIKAVIDEEQKMTQMSDEQGFEPVPLSADQIVNLKGTMESLVQTTAKGRVEIKGWNDDNTKMYYTVTDSKGAVQEMTMALGQGTNRLYQYRTATKETGTLIQQVFKGIKTKAKELLSFVIGGGSVYKVIELLRQGIQYVREIDLALTELKKVTDETEEEYDQFLQTAAKTGARLGSTISAVTEATATFAKLGYEMSQATEMAEAAIVYKNVGDNIASTEDAADSIISTMKGFRLEASESMEIVDRFNEVGNRFAITSQGIGEALRLSASALNEGGNSLDESIGLITAANEVVNDPSSVGTALKTLTLRLRGSKTELEEMGEDVSDMATTTSALQAKLLALTGGQVDIMLDENTFKNSTQILREMADAWEDMNDIQRASALELMGGKRQANVLSALIQNFDTVEKVIKTSANSAGSALKENERYLDSIQGKIDQFNNSLQAMWSNTLDSDIVKDFVAFGTILVKIIDKVGLLNSALITFGAFKGFGALFSSLKKDGVTLKSVWNWINQLTLATRAQQVADAAAAGTTLSRSNAEKLLNTSIVKRFATEQIDAKVKEANRTREIALIAAKEALALAEEQYADGLIDDIALQTAKNAVDAASVPITSSQIGVSTILGATFKGLAASIWGAVEAMVAFLFTNPVGWAILAIGAIAGLTALFSEIHISAEEASEKLEETKNKISDLESELESLQTELDEAREKIAELTALPYLSLTQQEDLDRLEREVELLERQIALKERQLAIEETKLVEDAEVAVKKNWGPTDKNKKDKADVNEYIEQYETINADAQKLNDMLNNWEEMSATEREAAAWELSNPYSYDLTNFYNNDPQEVIDAINIAESKATDISSKIEGIFSDPTYTGLEYGMSDNIDAFLDDFNNAQLKWEKALYGDNSTSSIIESLWGPNASEEMKAVKSEIDKIMAEDGNWANDDEKWQSKNDAIKNYIESLDETADGYHQLDYVVNELGKTSQDIADYFTVLNGAFNSNTIEGITQQYAKGIEAMERFKSEEDQLIELGNQYNELVNGNVDYNKRPFVSPEEMKKVYPKFDGEIATTWDADETYGDGKGGVKYTLKFTPILEDGTVLDQKSYTEYINNIFEELDKNNGDINKALEYDAANYKILINWSDGAVEYDENNESELDRQLGVIKNKHWELKQTIEDNQEGLFTIDKDGKFKASAVEFSEVLKGMDKDTRETFMNLAEAVKNGEKTWNQAMSEFTIAGFNKQLDILNDEFESLNNDMFKGAADEISGLIDTVNELQSALEDVAGTIDLLSTAEEQMANSGQISVKTALDLMETTDDYNKVVTIENGVLKLAAGAQEYVTQAKFNSIKTQLEASATLAETTYQTALASQSELDYADNANVVMTAESIKAEAVGRVSAVIVALGAAMDAISRKEYGSIFSSFSNTYKSATATVVAQSNAMKTSIAELGQRATNTRALADVYSFADGYNNFRNNYDFDKTPGDKYDTDGSDAASDAFQKAMDYWENRIAANQARYEQLQNEIDLLESKGQKADASYYEEQIKLENERLSLLQQQKAEAQSFLGTFAEGSEEWWEVANTLNDIEGELDSVTQSIVDLQDAIGEVDTYKFEEFNTRLDNLTSKLGTIRDLIAPDGEESWFDDEGNWTKDGVAVLGAYVQELELYKQGLEETEVELNKYNKTYSDNTKAYYDALGIHSEQEYYEKVEELTEQQYDFAESISDTEQSIVDMYESNIDAVEEYINTLIEGYNDYIDSVKEALDAERDLYEFKKNVQKQSKDINELERKISALSGSTNKSEIAERRKLEQSLYEARESLNDTYYDHAKDAQSEALDAEAQAYEETMNKFIEELRVGLEEATRNMDEFLMSVTGMVTLNADTVLAKYQETELPLSDAITNPWEAAKSAVENYSGDALELMNTWSQNGFLTTFPETVKGSLKSPWEAGQTAVNAFKTSVDTQMKNVVSAIETNVKTASGKLSALYQQIQDTAKKAVEISNDDYTPPPPKTPETTTPTQYASSTPDASTQKFKEERMAPKITPTRPKFKKVGDLWSGEGHTGVNIGSKTYTAAQFNALQIEGGDGIYFPYTAKGYKDRYVKKGEGYSVTKSGSSYKIDFHSFKPIYAKYAKGTIGTTRNEWAIDSEPQFGDELVLVPTEAGNLSYMRKGTGVVPADMTQKLFELAQIPTSDLMNKNLTAIVPNITKNDFKNEFNFESLVHVDTVDSDTLPKLEKMVDKKIDDFSKSLNYSLKKFTR